MFPCYVTNIKNIWPDVVSCVLCAYLKSTKILKSARKVMFDKILPSTEMAQTAFPNAAWAAINMPIIPTKDPEFQTL